MIAIGGRRINNHPSNHTQKWSNALHGNCGYLFTFLFNLVSVFYIHLMCQNIFSYFANL